MKMEEIRGLDDAARAAKLEELRLAIVKLRVLPTTGQSGRAETIRTHRKSVARILTFQRQQAKGRGVAA